MMNELYEQSYRRPQHFSFGENWRAFLSTVSDDRIVCAQQSLLGFLGGADAIANKTVIDIGCGSGLFSQAFVRLGARRVVSVDVDEAAVECAFSLRERSLAADAARWEIVKCSALDVQQLSALGKFDIVYSWGALHHTGDMWKAIENVMILVDKGGFMYIAIYNERKAFPTSGLWLRMKMIYNASPRFVKRSMEVLYKSAFVLVRTKTPRAYLQHCATYQSMRGMDWHTDVRDWLGGYPYEFSPSVRVRAFVEHRGFVLENVKDLGPIDGAGCNEFLFRKVELMSEI